MKVWISVDTWYPFYEVGREGEGPADRMSLMRYVWVKVVMFLLMSIQAKLERIWKRS